MIGFSFELGWCCLLCFVLTGLCPVVLVVGLDIFLVIVGLSFMLLCLYFFPDGWCFSGACVYSSVRSLRTDAVLP